MLIPFILLEKLEKKWFHPSCIEKELRAAVILLEVNGTEEGWLGLEVKL